jgi:hypothetical protein
VIAARFRLWSVILYGPAMHGPPPAKPVVLFVIQLVVVIDKEHAPNMSHVSVAARSCCLIPVLEEHAMRTTSDRFASYAVRSIALMLTLLLTATPAWSWGREGHRVVAKIATKNLSPDTRKKVAAILATNDAGLETAMASASTWPDEIDKKKTGTSNWHFIDVSVTAPFSVAGLCLNHDCIIDQIENMRDRLQMNKTGFTLQQPPIPPRPMTSQELAFLIHFVGDVHQPLHAATNGDRGGNCDNLTHPLSHSDGSATTELHAAWDVDEILAVFNKLGNEDATATMLFQRFKSGAQVPQLMPTDWARESNDLAKKDVYQKLHIPNHTAPAGQCATGIAKVNVNQMYLDGNVPDVEQQLMRAGIRLSNVLNQICAGSGCEPNPHGSRGR